MKRKICAFIMCGVLLAGMMPSTVMADVEDSAADQTQDVTEEASDLVETDNLSTEDDVTIEIVTDEDDFADVSIDYVEDAEVGEVTVYAEDTAEDTEDIEYAGDEEIPEESGEDVDEEETDADVIYEVQQDGIIVKVTAPDGALPEGAELVVERYARDSDEYMEAAEAIGHDLDDTNMAALDISFYYDGEEIEPTEAVKVSIDVSAILPADADASTIEVQHLVEIEDGEDVVIEPVVVANDSDFTEGTIDTENAVAEFEVDSFSDFTVTWTWTEQSGTTSTTSLTVTAYLDGVEIDGLADIEFDSQDDELNLETMLNDEDFGTSDYTFSWAYVTYSRTQGPTTETVTIGTQDDPVVAIEKTAGGQTSFIIIQASGTSTTVQASYSPHLYSYYITPTFSVEITPVAEDEAEDWLLQATLSHAGEYTSIEYEWSVTDKDGNETTLAKVDWSDETGRAFIVWDTDSVNNFDEIVVHVTATITREDGTTESASTSYTLEYGDEYVNLQMTYGPDNTALGAGVTVTLTNTVTGQIYTATTDTNGQILGLEIVPGIYLVEASTTIDGSNYSCSETVAMHDASANSGNYTINLNYADADKTSGALDSDKTDWNHVDIKLSTGSTGSGVSSEGVTVAITGVVITGSDGTIKYTADSTSIQAGASDNEWQIYFYTGTDTSGSYSHTIEFATTDSITIIYTLAWEDSEEPETYTVTIDASSTYDSGTTYPADGQRAYKLYNYLYGTNYSSNAQLMAAGVNSIDIGGMSMMLVAAILCDSSVTGNGAGVVTGTAGMWGMDFALSVEGFVSLSTAWMFDVEKTFVNHAMTAGMFTFTLDDATVDDNGNWTELEGVGSGWEYTWSNDTAGKGIDGNSSDTMSGIYIPYDDDEIQEGVTYYYILKEVAGDAQYITYDGTIFGAKVYVHTDDVETSQTYGEAVVEVTYYTLTANGDGTYTATEYTGEKITLGENNYPTFHFTNYYDTDITLVKKDAYGNDLEGATFTLTAVGSYTDPETEVTTTTYYDYDSTTQKMVVTTENAEGTQFTMGTVHLLDPPDGTYTLTEVSAPDGWQMVSGAITFTVEDGVITEVTSENSNVTFIPDLILYVANADTTTSLDVEKIWDDNNDHDGKRPESITVQLTADGNAVSGSTLTLDDSNDWKDTFTDLPVHNSSGAEIVYGVTEVVVAGYDTAIGEVTENDSGSYSISITNTHEPDTGSLVVSKTVVADQTQKETETPYTVTITSDENWSGMDLSATDSNGETVELAPVLGSDGETQIGVSFTISDGDEITLSGLHIGSYTVTETTGDGFTTSYVVTTSDGIEGDSTSNAPTVTVVEDSTEDVYSPQVAITNEYPVTANIPVTKRYDGSTWPEEGFTFTLTAVTTDAPMPSSTTVKVENSETVSFGDMTYMSDGTYYYTVAETAGTAGGVTYDDTVYYVQVTVSTIDNVKAVTVKYTTSEEEVTDPSTLDWNTATALDDGDSLEFSNSYEAVGSVTFGGEKTIEGIENTNQTFEFALYATDSDFTVAEDAEATDTQTVTGAGSFTFKTISYDSDVEGNGAGTYYYVVKETSTDGNGWTMDPTEYHITVVVEDASDGTFTLEVTCVDAEGETVTLTQADDGGYSFTGLDFTNEYEPAPTSVQFTGSKYITNSASDESTDKVFTFELYNADSSFATDGDAIQTKTTTGAGSITFDEFEYKETGTYYYVIQEKTLDEAGGWTIDPTVYNITVVVEDDGLGQLVATVTVNGTEVSGTDNVYGGFDFTNAYAAEGAVTLGVVKSISGVASTDKIFSFTLYNSDENFAKGDSIETITTDGAITNSTQVDFEKISYTEAGTYYYVITETGTAPDGWTFDTTEYHVTVTVTDNGEGTLTTSVSYTYTDKNGETQTENSAAFTNIYAANGSLSLTGTKTFEGGTLTENGFSFTMTDSTGVSVGDVTMADDGKITFPMLTYDETDIGGEYTYTITEVAGTDSSVQYDGTTYTVIVSVADNEDGTLNVTYTVNGAESGDITFTNYQKGSLIISKTFTGLTDEQIKSLTDFTITVTTSEGDTVAEMSLDDADEGSSYTWTVSGLVADTYTVTETGYSLDGYEVIAKSGEVTLTDGSEVSVNDTLAWGEKDTVAFTNDYTEVGNIKITKYVVAEEGIQKAHEDTNYTVVITASEDADFQWVAVTSSSGREITPIIDGKTITFTITEYETVTISGLPVGEYTVEETESDALTSESFIPVYKVEEEETEEAPTVTVASGSDNIVAVVIENEYPIGTYIMVRKNYNKDEYPEEGFTFTIEALSCDLEAEDVTLTADEMPMPNSTAVTIYASGVTGYFGYITYEHLGIYYYKVTETAGSEENIDYDTSVHYIKVVVAAEEGTYVETTDEYEAKADAETDDYVNLDYTEAGIVTAEFTNTAYDKLTIEKEVSGNGDTSEYEFEITLTKDGTGYTGDIETTEDDTDTNLLTRIVDFFTGIVKAFAGDTAETITFTDGKATVTVTAGESITLLIPSGWSCTVTEKTTGADSTTVYDGDGNVIIQAKGTTTEATAELGTIADSTQVKFVNSYRAYYPIDEEIVTDTDDIFDRDAWVKDEAVNEYNAIEIEMTTNLPTVTAYDLASGAFTMNFHEVLDHELVLDEDTADFSVYIGGNLISTAYYRITFDDDTGDDCNFHVDVDLTALYNDGIVTDDMLDGNTEITIFFFADLEGTGLNGSYRSTIWYDIYDGDEWLYTSNESVVEVYTYEIEIQKYDASTLEGDDYAASGLAGATLGVYYDEDCTDPVSRYGEAYTVISGDDGMVIFYGLADGTYYVKETEAPSGYVLSDEVLTVELGSDMTSYVYEDVYANTPESDDDNGSDGPGETGGTTPDGTTPDGTNPTQTEGSNTADADLPVLPIAGCAAAVALVAAALILRRKENNK